MEPSIPFENALKGDLKAFELLYRSLFPALYRFALGMVRDRTIAEEITQDAFAYIWERRADIHLKTSLESYLYASVRNKAINYLKLELPKLQKTSDINESGLSGTPVFAENEEARIKRKVQAAIDELPEKCRNIFVLSRYGGLSNAEIAEDLDISIKTVENQMTIALKKLRETLKKELSEFGIRRQ